MGRLPKTSRKKKPNESLISEATASVNSGAESDERIDFNAASVTGGRRLPASVNTTKKRKATGTPQDTTNRSANSADNDGSELNLTKRQKTSVGEAFNSLGGDFTSDDSLTKEGTVAKIADITGMAFTTDEERKWLINQLAATWKLRGVESVVSSDRRCCAN